MVGLNLEIPNNRFGSEIPSFFEVDHLLVFLWIAHVGLFVICESLVSLRILLFFLGNLCKNIMQ
jgi:hypothetical protein